VDTVVMTALHLRSRQNKSSDFEKLEVQHMKKRNKNRSFRCFRWAHLLYLEYARRMCELWDFSV